MLIGNHRRDLQSDELTYVAFRLTAIDALIEIDSAEMVPEAADSIGFLNEIPLLENVAPVVQVDLLASIWHRHCSAERHEASLLDAAVIYAVCQTAARMVREDPELAQSHMATGPRPCSLRIDTGLLERFAALFESFWSDIDFLTIEQFADVDPILAKQIKKRLGMSNSQIKKLEAALARGHASPKILDWLQGLLTETELQAWSRWLIPPLVVSLRAVVSEIDTPSDTFQAYINRKTGELFTASEDELSHLDDSEDLDDDPPEWQIEITQKLRSIRDSEDWLELPSKREFHEWDVMASFCQSIKNDTLREDMVGALHGSGAFGRFKSMIHRHGLLDEWDRYRERELADFVAAWLRANGIAFTK